MRTVAIVEAKNRFSELLSAVEQGEEITITRYGSPVARIVSISNASLAQQGQKERVSSVMAQLRKMRRGVNLGVGLPVAIEDGRD